MRLARVALVTTAVALVTTGCADAAGPGSTAEASSSPTATPGLSRPLDPVTAPEVLAYCPEIAPIHFEGVPSEVAEVFLCEASEILGTTGGGDVEEGDTDAGAASPLGDTRFLERASRVVTGKDALLEAYAVENAVATDGMCIELAADPLIVWIVGGGVATAIYAPVDECGIPTPEAAAAYSSVITETVAEVRVAAG